jgi:CRISPR-associated protein Csb1
MDRIVIKAQFESLLPTIQAAGFKDVGAGTFKNPKTGTLSVIVHSPQATANSLEAVSWNPIKNSPIDILKGLPYVEILDQEGSFRASTYTLPHRLASGYLLKHKESKAFAKQLQDDFKEIGEPSTVLKYCPNSLLHGVFFSHLGDGRIKLSRILSASVTAHDCERVALGGASHDPIVSSGTHLDLGYFEGSGSNKGSALGIGNLPYYQDAFVAKDITGLFIIDLAQIASLGLDEKSSKLLSTLAEFKIAKLLAHAWRIRSGCDLTLLETPPGLRNLSELETELKALINDCKPYFAEPTKTVITLTLKAPSSKTKADDTEGASDADD